MPLASLFRRNPHRDAAARLYAAIVERARSRVFFTDCAVPDSFDGRFELVALHAFLVLNRLKAERRRTAAFAQTLFDLMFEDFDLVLREVGVSDLGVGRHVKRMAQSFYGRILSYERGLAGDDAALAEALRRNLYGTAPAPAAALAAMAAYLRRCRAPLAATPVERLMAGEVEFAAPPPAAEPGEAP